MLIMIGAKSRMCMIEAVSRQVYRSAHNPRCHHKAPTGAQLVSGWCLGGVARCVLGREGGGDDAGGGGARGIWGNMGCGVL